MICLADCNNFYASCERVFKPRLEGKPIIILSNNDGCAVARSNEAKVLGIKMGAPYFEIKAFCEKHGIHVSSSNYTLYSDMSNRVMEVMKPFGVRQEIYSIDESFLDLTGIPELTQHCQNMRKIVKQYTGIPICVGIAPTKVLSKLANHLAKKHPFLNSVCNLEELGEERTNKALQITAVSEVWGVGRKVSEKLNLMGIKNVYQLKIANPKQLSKLFSVNLERIIYELNGIQCLELEDMQEPNKQIVSSRSFGQAVSTRDGLLSSLTYHAEQAGKKMRRQGLFARQMTVFVNTNRFKDDYFSSSVNIVFPNAINSFRYITQALNQALDKIYQPNIAYKKSGIIIADLISSEDETTDLFDNVNIKHDVLLPTLESIKKQFGKDAIQVASANLSGTWKMTNNLMSQKYTTDIDEIIEVS